MIRWVIDEAFSFINSIFLKKKNPLSTCIWRNDWKCDSTSHAGLKCWPQIMTLNGAFKTNNDAKIRNSKERGPTHAILKLEGQSSLSQWWEQRCKKGNAVCTCLPWQREEQGFGSVDCQQVLPEVPPFGGPPDTGCKCESCSDELCHVWLPLIRVSQLFLSNIFNYFNNSSY